MTGEIPDQGQLDLFLHSRTVVLVNDVIGAILARDADDAGLCLHMLRAEEPGHHLYDSLERLSRCIADWPLPAASPAEVDAAVRQLEGYVLPAAIAALGDKAVNFMLPLWRDLAQSAGARVYDAAFPQAYRAALHLKGGDSEATAGAIQAIPNFRDNPDAIHWLAVALHRMHGLESSRIWLFRLALLRPERFSHALSDIADPSMSRDWLEFLAAFHWLNPEGGNEGAWFPSWYLVEHPGVRTDLPGWTEPVTRSLEVLNAIARVIDLERQGYSAALISARIRLRDLDSQVFDFYMARRRDGHR